MPTRRHVLAALAAGVAAADDDVARARLAAIDWILRRPARRRLERALIDAALVVNATSDDVAARRRVLQVAALLVARVKPDHIPIDPSPAYAELAIPRPSRAPVATIAVAFGTAAIAAVATIALVTRPPEPSKTYVRPLPPPAAGAFKAGGVPLADPAIATLLVGELTQYVLQVDRDRRAFGAYKRDRLALAAKLRVAAPMQRTPALALAWAQLVDVFDRWVSLPLSSPDFQTVADEVRARARAVSDQLATLGLGYYLEGDVFASGDTAHAAIYSYRVDEVVYVDAGTTPRRVLDLRRIDELNIVHGLLGMESAQLGDPLVLLDRIDDHVATVVLPALAPDADFPLGGTWAADGETAWDDPAKLSRASGDAIRREMTAALGPADGAAATAIAALLVERAKLIDGWQGALAHRNLRLTRITDLLLPDRFITELRGRVPGGELDRVAAIEDELARREAPRIASRLLELVAKSVRHHEAQHGLDDARADKLRYPDALAEHVGAFENQKGEPRPAAEHANAELSAYTSQIANDPTTPQLALWSMARHAFTQHRWGSAESYVAVLVLDGIARHLGCGAPNGACDHAPIIHDGMIDRTRLAAIVATFPTRSTAELRAAAAALWQDFYGEPLVPIADRSARLSP